MHAAGVVADHAAQGATVVARGIGPEGQMMLLGGIAEIVEHYAWLDPGNAPLRIDFQDLIHVLGEIHDDGNVAALAGQRSAATAAKDRSAVLARQSDRRNDVIDVTRKNYSDGNLAIIGAVSGVEGAAAGIEADFAAELGSQSALQGSRDSTAEFPGSTCAISTA